MRGSSGREELRAEKMVSCFICYLSEYILTASFSVSVARPVDDIAVRSRPLVVRADGRSYEWKNGELLYLFFVRVHPNCIFCVCLPPGLSMTSPFGLGRSERPQAIFERPPGGARPQDFRPGATGL